MESQLNRPTPFSCRKRFPKNARALCLAVSNIICILCLFMIVDSGAQSRFTWTWCVIPSSVSSVGFTMFVRHGILWSGKRHFPICHCRTRTGWKKTLKRACCPATRSACTIKVSDTRASVTIVGKHSSFVAMRIAACTPTKSLFLFTHTHTHTLSRMVPVYLYVILPWNFYHLLQSIQLASGVG